MVQAHDIENERQSRAKYPQRCEQRPARCTQSCNGLVVRTQRKPDENKDQPDRSPVERDHERVPVLSHENPADPA